MVNGIQTGMVYYVEVPDPAIHNNSATFDFDPLPFVCAGQPFQLDYSATDVDGDLLVYSLVEPWAGTLGHPTQTNPQAVLLDQVPGPYPLIEWTPGYSTANIFNSSPAAMINSSTGFLTAKADVLGLFAIAFEVYEYRNGNLLSMIRREIEIASVICANQAPALVSGNLPSNLTYHIFETDTLCFNATYVDADGDNVQLVFTGNVFGGPGILAPYASATLDSGLIEVASSFCWNTRCGHGRSQPYVAVFEVIDDGCPMPALTLDSIFIYVDPMPQAGPVNLQCIGLVDDHTNRLIWVDASASWNYFEKLEIYRSHNGGAYGLLQTITSDSVFSYDDETAVNNSSEEYCYFIIATNNCGQTGPSSDTLCSNGEGNIKLNYIEYVTVVDDKEIEMKWADFPDGPFSTFYIYRSDESVSGDFELVETLEHPTVQSWTDQSVNPDESSYCYYMLNRDYCGGLSQQSDLACSILLQGTSAPWVNRLNWSLYRDWSGGVHRYEIFRAMSESGVFELTHVTPDSVNAYDDQQLNTQHGIYHYVIKAWEGIGGSNAASTSNEIELFQEPFVFLPNAFTPNNDSKNDRWEGFENFVKEASVRIFNRWGSLVYAGDGINAGWDGIYNGQDAPEGLYVYEVSYDGFGKGQRQTVRGTISLIR